MATSTTRSQFPVPKTNGNNNSVLDISAAYDAVTSAATSAQKEISKAAGSTEKVVKANPLASVGIALGGGVVLGVLAAKLFSHKQTFSEQLHDQLGLKKKIARAINSWL